MKISGLLFGTALAAIAFAESPRQRWNAERSARRRDAAAGFSHSTPNPSAAKSHDRSIVHEYSETWAGAALAAPPEDGATFLSVKGSFKAPANEPGFPSDAPYWVTSAWVGIDGYNYIWEILQAGVDTYIYPNGTRVFRPWIEYYPRGTDYLDNLYIRPGDVISVTVTADTPSKGVAVVENETRGTSASRTITAPDDDSKIAGVNAEWIIENYGPGFANMHTLQFTEIAAYTTFGEVVGLDNATVIDMKSDGKAWTACGIQDDTTLACDYALN